MKRGWLEHAQEMKQTCQQLEKQREQQENGTGSKVTRIDVDLCKVRPKKRDVNVGLSWLINLMNTIVKIS